jgi:hypothetical protein
MIVAASSTERRTCRLSAPMHRSRASSRVRCATVTDIVRLTMNAPTSTDTPPATSLICRTSRRPGVSLADADRTHGRGFTHDRIVGPDT